MPTDELDDWPAVRGAGPGAARRRFDAAIWLKRGSPAGRAPIKLLLLDQRIVAGLGNIYVCEALYRAGIAPARAGGPDVAGRGSSGWSRRSRRCSTRRSRRAARPCATSPARRRARLFLEAVRASMAAKGEPCALRRHGPANRPGRPLDLLLPAMPALSLTVDLRPSLA